jgi:hypothetical protein
MKAVDHWGMSLGVIAVQASFYIPLSASGLPWNELLHSTMME